MAQEIIGREPEIKEIEALYQTNKPVFAVVYGRRRVGKTFLIRELLGDKFAFYHTGLSPYELQGKKLKEQQLSNFYSSLIKYGSDIKRVPTDWLEAFDALISLLEKKTPTTDKLYSLMNFHGWILPVPASLPPWNIFGMDGERAERT